jgi:hypothetical protein
MFDKTDVNFCMTVSVIVFNATFNNISVISWRSVLLVEEARVLEKTTDNTNCNAMTFNSGYISTEIAQNCETELFYMCQEIVKVKTGKWITLVKQL